MVEVTPEFAARYGSGAIARIQQIQQELTDALLAIAAGWGREAISPSSTEPYI